MVLASDQDAFWTPLLKGVAVLAEALRYGHATPSNSPGSLIGSHRRCWWMLLLRTEAWLRLTGQLYCCTDLRKAEKMDGCFATITPLLLSSVLLASTLLKAGCLFLCLFLSYQISGTMLHCNYRAIKTVYCALIWNNLPNEHNTGIINRTKNVPPSPNVIKFLFLILKCYLFLTAEEVKYKTVASKMGNEAEELPSSLQTT